MLTRSFLTLVTLGVASVSALPSTASCNAPAVVHFNNSKLPDPFLFADSKTRVRTKEQWNCRREQINQLLQRDELGILPAVKTKVTASYTEGNLTVKCAANGTSISFNVPVQLPTSGKGPFPAVIAYGGLSIPKPDGVALLTFNNDDIALENDQTSRGVGKFFDLYGSDHGAGAMIAWSWAISRLIDALEMTPAAHIDTEKLAVTGCSRNGKGALVAGAFDDRIALTIPQESGEGGDACWRLSLAEQAAGYVVQTAPEIVQENVWFSESFDAFVNHTERLPFDHHTLAGLIAPRGLLAIENTAYVWLSPWSSNGCMIAAHKVWEALGVPDHMGFTQDGNHSHCVFPADQISDVTAYFDKFLLGQKHANTSIFKSPETFDQSQWIDWKVPKLS